ncbi:MAG: hypothetical protein RLZZ437_807 [Pseudomonadota bacterium]|jgi:hypothetical protein
MPAQVRDVAVIEVVLVSVATLVLTAAGYAFSLSWPLWLILLPLLGVTLFWEAALILLLAGIKRLIWGKAEEPEAARVPSRNLKRIWLFPILGLAVGGTAGFIHWLVWTS